jgi:hypothetical protein
MSATTSSGKRRLKRRWRVVLWCALGLVVLVAIVLAAAPSVASRMLPGEVRKATARYVNGEVRVEKASLSWFGSQRIGPIVVVDDEGREAARLNVRVERGLLGLLTSIGSVGTVTIDGDVHVVVDENNTSNLERLIVPSTEPDAGTAGEPVKLPRGLAGVIQIERLIVTYEDRELMALLGKGFDGAVVSLSGRTEFGAGRDVSAHLESDAHVGPSSDRSAMEAGRVVVDATVSGLIGADGVVNVPGASVEARVDADGVAMAIVDSMIDAGGWLTDAIGEEADLSVDVIASSERATATIGATAPGLGVDLALDWADKRLRLAREATVTWNASGLASRLNDLEEEDAIRFNELPTVEVSLGALDVGLDPSAPGLLDLRGGVLRLASEVGPTSGTVATGEGVTPFHVVAREFSISSEDLANLLTIQSRTAARVEEQHAGEIELSFVLRGLAEANGAPRLGAPESIDGTMSIRQVPTALLQPLAPGLDLATDIGPFVNVELVAEATPGEGGGTSKIDVALRTKNVRADASLDVDTKTIELHDGPMTVLVRDPSATLRRLLAAATIESASSIEVNVDRLRVDVAELASGPEAIEAHATVRVNGGAGQLALEGAAPVAFVVKPATIEIEQTSGAGGATIRLDAPGSTLGGHPLGTIAATVTAAFGGADSAWTASEARLEASIAGLASAGIAPLLAPAGLRPVDLGESIDMQLTARVDPGDLLRDGALTFESKSSEVDIRVGATVKDAVLRAGANDVVIVVRRAGRLASRYVGPEAGLTLQPGGWVRVATNGAAVPIDRETLAPQLDRARMDVKVTSANLRGSTPTETIVIDSLEVNGSAGASSHVEVAVKATANEAPFNAIGAFDLPGTFDALLAGLGTPARLRPVGSITLDGVPVGLLASLAPLEGREEAATIGIGPTLTATVTTSAGPNDSLDVRMSIDAAHATSSAQATLAPGALTLESVGAKVDMTAQDVSALLGVLAPDLAARVRPSGKAGATLALDSVRIPIDDRLRPDLAGASAANATLTIAGGAALHAPTETEPDRFVGAYTLRDVKATVSVPAGALATGDEAVMAHLAIDGRVVEEGKAIATIDVKADAPMKAGALSGPIEIVAGVPTLDTSWLDAVIGQPGLLAGALGGQASASVTTSVTPGESDFLSKAVARVDVSSALLKLAKPALIHAGPDRISLGEPLSATWTVAPAWLAARMTSEEEGARPAFELTKPAPLKIAVQRLVVSRGDGPFAPGVFAMDGTVTSDLVETVFDESTSARYKNVFVRARTTDSPDEIQVVVKLDDADAQRSALNATALVEDFSNDVGAMTIERAVVSIDATLPQGRTDVIDSLAKRGDQLEELLGPTVDVTLDVDRFRRAGGSIKAEIKSPRAEVAFNGVLGFGEFVARGPVTAKINEVTPGLAATILDGMPLIGSFEKRREDGPALVNATNLRIPVDGDLSKLSGDVHIDLGAARFKTSSAFAAILDIARQNQEGMVGRRLEPLDVRMRDGVISYDAYTIPLGEFKLVTQANAIDLVNRRVDVLTWIPFGALGDEAAGRFNTGLGSALGRALPSLDKLTRVPWRTKGAFGSLTTVPDPQAFINSFGAQLLRPDKLFEERLRQILGGGEKKDEGGG